MPKVKTQTPLSTYKVIYNYLSIQCSTYVDASSIWDAAIKFSKIRWSDKLPRKIVNVEVA